jgi:hypothetical protein
VKETAVRIVCYGLISPFAFVFGKQSLNTSLFQIARTTQLFANNRQVF